MIFNLKIQILKKKYPKKTQKPRHSIQNTPINNPVQTPQSRSPSKTQNSRHHKNGLAWPGTIYHVFLQ